MIEIINSWAQKIIIVVIICTIIEMILPEGKNKKYIKTVIGIYVVFTIISPIISKINNSNTLDLSKYFKTENNITIETSSPVADTNEYIEEVYKEKLKTDIKAKIEAMNYGVKNIDLEIETEDEETYGTILKLNLSISQQKQEDKQNNIQIEKIVIGEEKKEEATISDKEKEKIKQYLAEIYYMLEDDICIY
ncbi:MAG: stage III sporulation protein AF [Clostridia bacterium]|nr:stage III sporulation protein AF [Clostridia bacterium]